MMVFVSFKEQANLINSLFLFLLKHFFLKLLLKYIFSYFLELKI